MDAKALAEGFRRINKEAMKAVGDGDYAKAAAVLKEGLALEEKLGLTTQVSESHANIGNVYFSAGAYDEALAHLLKAQELFRKNANNNGSISASLTISTILELNGDAAGAQRQLESAYRIAHTGEQRGAIMYRIACLHQRGGRYYQAQESFNRALTEMERLDRREDTLLCLLARAALFAQMNRGPLASRDVARARSLAGGSDRLAKLFADSMTELGLQDKLSSRF